MITIVQFTGALNKALHRTQITLRFIYARELGRWVARVSIAYIVKFRISNQVGNVALMVLAVFLPLPVLAGTINFQKDGFSLTFPPGWIAIPSEVITQAQLEMAKAAPNAPKPQYDYGFQFGSKEQWFTYPYILIQIKRTGRVPESQLEKLDKYDSTETSQKLQKLAGKIMTEVEIGKMRYDPATRVIWVNTGSNVAELGRVSGISAIMPTEFGIVQLMGYAKEREFMGFLSNFHEIVRSASFADGVKYQPQMSDRLPQWLRSIKWEDVLMWGLLGVGFAVFARFRRKYSHKALGCQ